MNAEDPEQRIVHSWSEKDYWTMQARVVLTFMLGGLALIWIGVARCASYSFSRSPFTFLRGFIPIAGGMVLIVLACFGMRRRHREKKRVLKTTTWPAPPSPGRWGLIAPSATTVHVVEVNSAHPLDRKDSRPSVRKG